MPMTESDARALIVSVLKEVQEISGREWQPIDPKERPIGVLDGFDSLSAVEVTVMIEERLGCKLPLKTLFVSDDGKRALTLGEVSDRVAKLMSSRGGSK